MFSSILGAMKAALIAVLGLLPDSPFRGFIDGLADVPFIGFLNYFIPVSDFVALLSVWVAAVGLFYICSAVLRFAKAIE